MNAEEIERAVEEAKARINGPAWSHEEETIHLCRALVALHEARPQQIVEQLIDEDCEAKSRRDEVEAMAQRLFDSGNFTPEHAFNVAEAFYAERDRRREAANEA